MRMYLLLIIKLKNTLGVNVEDQVSIDKKLIELDGTNNKSKIGANTTIAVSMASLKALQQ